MRDDEERSVWSLAPEDWGVDKGTPSYHSHIAWDHVTDRLVPRVLALREEITERRRREGI